MSTINSSQRDNYIFGTITTTSGPTKILMARRPSDRQIKEVVSRFNSRTGLLHEPEESSVAPKRNAKASPKPKAKRGGRGRGRH